MDGAPAPTCRPVGRGDGPTVERLFGANGACGGCWCMHWRVPRGGRDWQRSKGAPNRAAFLRLLRQGAVRAVIAEAAGAPVGWCSFGPVEEFPRLAGARSLRRERPAGTWAIVCFYVPPGWRRQGLAGQMLRAAITECRAGGAAEVEGWPAVPRDGELPAAFAWTGVPALFRGAGFRPVRRPAGSRPIYRLPLSAGWR